MSVEFSIGQLRINNVVPRHAVRDLNTCTVCVSSMNTSFESKRRAGGPVLLSYREQAWMMELRTKMVS